MVARGGHAWLLWGGMRGCSGGACMVAPGVCMVAPGGGMHGCSRGGMRGCSAGGRACVVALGGGVHGCLGGHAWLLPRGRVWLLWGVGRAWLLPGVFSMRYGQ